jgi:membrane protease YdiL (CAAX protease family)
LVFPTAISLAEVLGEEAGDRAAIIYGAGKAVQVALPVACLMLLGRRPLAEVRRSSACRLALAFGLVVAAGIVVLYYCYLRNTALFSQASARVHGRLEQFGLNSPGGFALFALAIAGLHSLLEEFYWRWFLFGELEQVVSVAWAMGLSSLAFMVPHVFALATFLGEEFTAAIAVLTLCVGAGGVVWAWMYHQSRSLLAPWLSHFLVDAGLFVVGYDLFFIRS